MNDNGGTFGIDFYNAGKCGGGRDTPWLGGTRAASFWRWPGTLKPADVKPMAGHIDVFPTLAEIAGAKLTDAVKQQVEGRSLVPLLKNADAPWTDRYWITHVGRWPDQADPAPFEYTWCAIRNGRWQLVNDQPDGKPTTKHWQLFDLTTDYGEKHDVAAEHPDIVKQFDAAYEAWWASVQPQLVNEKVIGPKVNPFKELYWKQFGKPTP